MDWSILADLALGAAAFKMAHSADRATAELRKLVAVLTSRADNHETRLKVLETTPWPRP